MAKAEHVNYRPVKRAFLWMRIGASAAVLVVLTVAVIVAAKLVDGRIAWALTLIAVLAAYAVADGLRAFAKQRYEFGRDSVFFGTGTIFTDRQTELRYKNITNVRVIKPFIEYHLFGTGKILIESAGSSGVEVEMLAIAKPYKVFEEIRDMLGKRTFSLTYGELLSRKKPAPLAVMLQIIGGVLAGIAFATFSVGITTIASVISGIPFVLLLIMSPLVALIGLAYLYAVWQDQLRRTYYVYSDVIHYSKGFLTKQEAFMPAGNLANTRLTQGFVGKLLNLQDVVVSCQGQGSEINFANLQDSEDMQRAINSLINRRESLKATKHDQPEAKMTEAVPKSTDQVVEAFTAAPTPRGEDVTAQDFRMQMKRALWAFAPLYPLLIFVPPALIALLVRQYIVAKRTVYRLTDGGVASYYTFLTTKNVEFSRDKITGLVISRNPLDRYFNTCTVSFWSIGSGSSVDFRYIDYNENLVDLMRAKAGIIDDEELEVIKPRFSLGAMVKASLADVFLAVLLLAGSLVVAWLLSPWFVALTAALLASFATVIAILHRRYARASLRLGRHTVTVKIGVLIRKQFYARADNVKDITLTKYPWSNMGQIQFNVAGERVADDGSGNNSKVPNRFSIGYMPGVASDVRGERSWLDQVLLHKPSAGRYAKLTGAHAKTPVVRSHAQPALRNSLAMLIPLHIILFPLIVILPFSILICRFWLRRVHYLIEDERVIKRWGVIYRKQTSVLFIRLDYIKTGQDFLNKAFKNGNLYLYTTGSSSAELTLANIPDHTTFHQTIKTHYEK